MCPTIRSAALWLAASTLAVAACDRSSSGSLDSATRMLRARDYRGCIRVLTEIPTGADNSRDAHIIRAQCAMGVGDYNLATRDYNEALRNDSRSAQLLYSRGAARSQSGDLNGGIADFSQAIEIDPSYAPSYAGRSAAKRVLDRTEDALGDLNDGIQHEPNNANLYHARGCLYFDERAWDRAQEDFTRAATLDPQHQNLAQARLWLIRTRLHQADADLKLASYLAEAAVKQSDGWELTILEFFAGRRSEDDLFRETVNSEPVVESSRRTQAAFYAGSVRLLKGDRAGARRMFRTAVTSARQGFSEYLSAVAELRELNPKQG